MANPIVTTTPLIAEHITNNSLRFWGNTVNNEWETTAWGFWYYKKSAGIGTKVYIASATTPLGEGDFQKQIGSLIPYTIYVFQAHCDYKFWEVNEEYPDGHWIYIEILGDWVEAETYAYCITLQVFACDINKSTGAVTFYGSVNDNDGGNCIERGFEYGLTKNPTWKVLEEGNFSEEMFSLNVSGLPLNTDFYVRTYLKSSSGHYAYTAGGEDTGWAKFTTKILTNDIAVLSNGGFFTANEDYLRVFNKNGQENNAFKLPIGQMTTEITLDGLGNAYYGWTDGATSYNISKRRLSDEFLLGSWVISGFPRGVCIGKGDYIFTLESDLQAKNAILYKRNISDLTEIMHINLNSIMAYFCGIIADSEDHVYAGKTTDPDRIEKYALYGVHNIIGLFQGVSEVISDYSGTLWQWDYSDYDEGRDATNASYVEDDFHAIYIGQYLSSEYEFGRAGLFFNTLGETGEITKVILKLYALYDHVGDFNIIVQNGQPDYPNKPMIGSDYDRTKYSGNGGSISTGNWARYEFKNMVLNEDGISWINKQGYTKLLLRAEGDINGIAPIEVNDGWVAGSLADEDKRPRLFIHIGANYFKIVGDISNVYPEGVIIQVDGSSGNDGMYTISEGGAYFDGINTILPIDEPIPSEVIDGTITRVGNATMISYVNLPSPITLTHGSIGVTTNFVYAGAWFDYPVKAPKDLSSCEEWKPSGEWHHYTYGGRDVVDFFHIRSYANNILAEGTPYSGYSIALAGYDENEAQLWKTDLVRGIQSMGGYPFSGGATIINTKAERDSTQTAIRLYGEITEILAADIAEKGFEYLIQDGEPAPEATGIEIIKTKPSYTEFWDIGEYWAYEYEGNDVDFWDRLYNLEENTIWWFRAFCRDDQGNKSTAETWMKNVPTMTTFECTEVGAQQAKGNGEMTDKGANVVTERGFRIIKEYVGDLFSAIPYEYDGFNCDNLESEELLSPEGVLIGFQWRGDLYRDSLDEDSDFDLEVYEKILGGGFLGEGFGIYLKPNDIYKVQAIAVNELGMGFGEEVNLATGIIILPSDPEEDAIISETIAEKTITLGTIPDGCTVTRIGIRLGRTTGCSDIHVYEDGSWGSGGSHTFLITGFVPGSTYYKMPYIILNHGDYEEEIKAIPDYRNPERAEEWLEDFPIEVFPDVEDEDDLDQIVTDSSVGDISYRTIIKEIKCEKIGEQSFIDMYGRRRSQTINNHLIQTHENCKTIAIEYVEKFQILKMKIAIDYDIPIPFEREDVILLGDGKHKYREDGEGLIAFTVDGAGTILQQSFILAKIRKIDSNYISGTEVILSLELEV